METIRQKLIEKSDKKLQEFSTMLNPDVENILGVRMPVLRNLAKEIYKSSEWKEFVNSKDIIFWEELMLQGMVIGLIKDKPEKILEYVRDYVPKLDGWGTCDGFCAGLKFTKKNKELVWKFIQPYFDSEKEFEIRFAYVMLLTYFIDEEHIDRVLKFIDEFKDDRYYTKMAVAWALSICYVKFPQKTLEYLKVSKLGNWTYNKGIQKTCESLRIDKETKNMLKTLKR